MKRGLLLSCLLVACASIPTLRPEATRVELRESLPSDGEYEAVGSVSAGGWHYGRSPQVANESVKTELRNQAAAKGADVVVLTMQDWGFYSNNASATGIAYRRRISGTSVARVPEKQQGQGSTSAGLFVVLELQNKLPAADRGSVDAAYFANQVRSAVLRAIPGVRMITRENLLVLLESTGKNVADCEGECEVETGRRLGADSVVSGEILRVGANFKLDLRLHETHEGRLLGGRAAQGRTIEELDANVEAAVADLCAAAK